MPEDDYVDVFVCNVHSTDNICVNFYGEEYSVSNTCYHENTPPEK